VPRSVRGDIHPITVPEAMKTGTFGEIKLGALPVGDALVEPKNPTWVPVWTPAGWDWQFLGYLSANITIQSSTEGSGYWMGSGTNNVDRARVLVHELGHVFNQVLGLGGSKFKDDAKNAESQEFNQKLELECFPR
jgi:hypothetical protein